MKWNDLLFLQQSKANEMLQGLSYFEHCIKRDSGRTPKEAFSWGGTNKEALANCLLNICQTTHDIINKEPRIVHVNAPAYVLGMLLDLLLLLCISFYLFGPFFYNSFLKSSI